MADTIDKTTTQQPPVAHGADASGADGKTPPPDAQPTDGTQQDAAAPKKKGPASAAKGIMIAAGIGAVVLIGGVWGIHYYHYSSTHVGTDDAFVAGDIVNVSPLISGTLNSLLVSEGDAVKRGQLVARLDDSGPMANLRQAEATYAAASSQIPQAQTNLALQQAQTDAAIKRAQAGLAAQRAKTSGAQSEVNLVRQTNASQVAQAQGQLGAAEAQYAQAQAQVGTAAASVGAYEQAIVTARHAAQAVGSNIAAAQANEQKAANDLARYTALLKVDAVTRQQYDAVVSAAAAARSQLASTRQQYEQALSQVAQAQANLTQSRSQLLAARRAADASRQQIDVARAGIGLATANAGQVGVQQANVQNNQQTNAQALADLDAALAQRQQISLRKQQISTARSQAAQQRAALDNAKVAEGDTYIYAPTDGEVVRKSVSAGAAVAPGQTLFTMTQRGRAWVTANFKETQMAQVRPGESAEVEVDAFPGLTFHGKVTSINQATGASTALLPPDNATGNFTKVVQRVPVRIDLYPAAKNEGSGWATANDIRKLVQGESVNATIDISSAR